MKTRSIVATRWFLSLVAALPLAFAAPAAPTTNSWNVNADGYWNTPANWDPAGVPNEACSMAIVTNAITASRTITCDVNVTNGALLVSEPGTSYSFTITNDPGTTWTFDNLGAGARVDQPGAGTRYDYFYPNVTLADDLTVSNATKYMGLWGVISGSKGIIKDGPGAAGYLVLNKDANDFSGGVWVKGGYLYLYSSQAGTGPITLGDTEGSNVAAVGGGSGTITNAITIVPGSSGIKYLRNGSGRFVIFSGPITMNADNVEINTGSGTLYVSVTGAISGSGRMRISGVTTAGQSTNYTALAGANTFSGGIDLRAVLRVNHNNALGTGLLGIYSGVLCTSMAATTVTNEVSVTNNFTFGQTGGGTGLLTLAGPVYLGNTTKTITVNRAQAISGVIWADPGIGFTKSGAGSLTLSGANTYNGLTTVAAGTLTVSSAHVGGGNFAVTTSDLAFLGVLRDASVPTLDIPNLTMGVTTGATLNCVFPTGPSATTPLITVNNLTLNGTNRLDVYGGGFTVGQFPLLRYTNLLAGGFRTTPPHLPQGVVGTITNNTADSTVYLLVTSATAASVKWTGLLSAAWDYSSLNWSNTLRTTYGHGDHVTLDDTAVASTDIILRGTFEPATVGVTNATKTYSLGGEGTLAGSMSLSKAGAGLLTVRSANTYTGGTVVRGGTLRVSNTGGSATGSGAVTVQDTGTLGGNGIVAGAVTVGSGATLSPGESIGALTLNNTLTLNAGSTVQMQLNQAAGTNDVVQGVTTLNYGGTLVVTNLAGAFAGGESYKLFNATTYNGNFAATQLPALGPGLRWVWTPATGTLSVAVTASTPTNLVFGVSNGTLSLSWPESHMGWHLQSNSVSVADPNAWHDIAGSESVTNLDLTINPAVPQVYYRLRR